MPISLRSRMPRLVAAITVAAAATLGAAPKSPPPRGAELIESRQMRDYLTFLASDELEGRDTPSRGLDIAARYLASQLSRFGLKPAGDDGFFQRIAMTRSTIDPSRTTVTLKDRTFVYGDDYLAAVAGEAEAPLLYVGHGYIVKAKGIDAYKGIDVKGRILVAAAGLPEGISPDDVRGEPGTTFDDPQSYARRNGAAGVVLIPDFTAASGWARMREETAGPGTATVNRFEEDRPRRIPVIVASPAMLSVLFEGESAGGPEVYARAQQRKGGDAFALRAHKVLKLDVRATREELWTQNVAAVHEGSDPKLKEEYVALGAHYDHLGLATRGSDRVHNGADDDGSGTTALLAMAEALARGQVKTKRSILFVWHAGEESGLLGARYFTSWPTVRLDRVVAQLNVDMIGRSRLPGDSSSANAALTGPGEVYVIGSKMMSSELGELSERVNRNYLNLSFNYKYDNPNDPERFFFRSDHYRYASKGIPIIFYFSGVHEDYHRPSDEVSKIDFSKMEKVARTIYATALALADAPTRPVVDRKLPAELTEP
jgi:hypothetical protein